MAEPLSLRFSRTWRVCSSVRMLERSRSSLKISSILRLPALYPAPETSQVIGAGAIQPHHSSSWARTAAFKRSRSVFVGLFLSNFLLSASKSIFERSNYPPFFSPMVNGTAPIFVEQLFNSLHDVGNIGGSIIVRIRSAIARIHPQCCASAMPSGGLHPLEQRADQSCLAQKVAPHAFRCHELVGCILDSADACEVGGRGCLDLRQVDTVELAKCVVSLTANRNCAANFFLVAHRRLPPCPLQ